MALFEREIRHFEPFEINLRAKVFNDQPHEMNPYVLVYKEESLVTGALWATVKFEGNIMLGYPKIQAYITECAVRPDLHGRGIGTALQVQFMYDCLSRNYKNLGRTVMNTSSQQQSIAMKLGFKPIGVVEGDSQDYILMLANRRVSLTPNPLIRE